MNGGNGVGCGSAAEGWVAAGPLLDWSTREADVMLQRD
jgi:hypothetical protein